jgi:hypothetical protein
VTLTAIRVEMPHPSFCHQQGPAHAPDGAGASNAADLDLSKDGK